MSGARDNGDEERDEQVADPSAALIRDGSLDFSGPPLLLPDDPEAEPEEPGGAASGDPSPPAERTLDGRGSRAESLDGPAPSESHDAWTADRLAQGRTSALPAPPPEAPAGHRRVTPQPAADALGLVDRSRPPPSELDLAGEMRERYGLGDFTGALHAAELLLGHDASHAEAQRFAVSSRRQLEQMYSSRLGSFHLRPVVTVDSAELRWLGIDHRAGFLLSRIDGVSTIEQLLDVSGMARLESLKMLAELLDLGVIRLEQ